MKRILITVVALVAMALPASAQGWLDAIRDVATDVVTEVVNEVTGGTASEVLLPGTWSYTEPAVRLSSEDTLATAVAAAATSTLESRLQQAYDYVNIKPGSCSITFTSEGTFTQTLGSRTLSGTYTYDPETKLLVMEYSSTLLRLGSLTGYAHVGVDSLEIVYDCSRLMDLLRALGSRVQLLSSITSLAESYDGVMIGFSYSK